MIWVLFVNLHASFMTVRRNSIELLFWQLNNQPQIPNGALLFKGAHIEETKGLLDVHVYPPPPHPLLCFDNNK